MRSFATPTLRLLNSSSVVAIGGSLRLHIAFLLAGLAMRIPVYVAFALIIYATYTLDRALDCKEDAINKAELQGADGRIGILACVIAFSLGTIIFAIDGIYLAPLFPFIVGFIYTRGIRIGPWHLKLKGGVGMKNTIIGITWGGTIALIVSQWCSVLGTVVVIFVFYGLKLFVTSCVNDFKDVRGDLAAGIRTLPASLGENLTRRLLIALTLLLHAVMLYAVWAGLIRGEWVLLVYSLAVPTAFLLVYSSSFEKESRLFLRRMREIVIYWESAISLACRACAGA